MRSALDTLFRLLGGLGAFFILATLTIEVGATLRPDLRILATSRQALGLTGEIIWRVRSLSLPDSGLQAPTPGDSHLTARQGSPLRKRVHTQPAPGGAL